MSLSVNRVIKNIEPNRITKFGKKIANIDDLIMLTVGEPDLNTPDHIKLGGIRGIINNASHYTNARGILPLREAVSSYLNKKYGLRYDPKSDILVTAGVAESLYATLAGILNPGDEVVLPSPTYPMYEPDVTLQGGKSIFIDTSNTNFKLDPKELDRVIKERKGKIKAIILNYPSNPIGITYTKEELEELAKVIRDNDIFCISDEIYSELSYDVKHYSIGNLIPERTFTLNGVSKTYSMTGWRIGLICGPGKYIEVINKIHEYLITSATGNAQYAALEAYKNGFNDGDKPREIYRKRRDVLRDGLAKAGFHSVKPSGSFYIFVKIPEQFDQDDNKFAYRLAKEAHVGILPGSIFGDGGEGYLRASYSVSMDEIKESIKRIQKFVDKNS